MSTGLFGLYMFNRNPALKRSCKKFERFGLLSNKDGLTKICFQFALWEVWDTVFLGLEIRITWPLQLQFRPFLFKIYLLQVPKVHRRTILINKLLPAYYENVLPPFYHVVLRD